MTEAERALLFYVAQILAKTARPEGFVRPEIERLLGLAIKDATKNFVSIHPSIPTDGSAF